MAMQAEWSAVNQYLRQRRGKRSRKRELILEHFLRTESHLSAEDLYRLVSRHHPEVSRSTVYRALKVFCQSGVARRVDLRDGRERYEHEYQHPHHDHMVCTACGRTFEFVCQEIEALQRGVAESIDFSPASHSLQIFGECAECRGRGRRRRIAAPPTSRKLIELARAPEQAPGTIASRPDRLRARRKR